MAEQKKGMERAKKYSTGKKDPDKRGEKTPGIPIFFQ